MPFWERKRQYGNLEVIGTGSDMDRFENLVRDRNLTVDDLICILRAVRLRDGIDMKGVRYQYGYM